MNIPITASLSPAAVRAYFMSRLPAEELPGTFFELSSQSLLHSISAFYSGTDTRPSCTLENVIATVRYPHITHVLHMLSTDPECSAWVLHLQAALARQAVLQVAGVVTFIDVILGHVRPEKEAQERIHSFISAFAA
jgi:hypothetical protein